MNRGRLLSSLLTAGALMVTLAFLPVSSFGQQPAPPPPPKKKASKVWTNEDLQQLRGRGVNVVGTSLKKPEVVAPATEKAAAPAPTEPQSTAAAEKEMLEEFKALTPEQRAARLAELEADVAEIPQTITNLRDQLFAAEDEGQRTRLQQEIGRLEALLPQRERELELLRQVIQLSSQPAAPPS